MADKLNFYTSQTCTFLSSLARGRHLRFENNFLTDKNILDLVVPGEGTTCNNICANSTIVVQRGKKKFHNRDRSKEED